MIGKFSSDIYLQSRYDSELSITLEIGRNSKPLDLGRGSLTRIIDTKCSREQLKISHTKQGKKFKQNEPMSFDLLPVHRSIFVYHEKKEEMEEIKKSHTCTLQVGDSFSIFYQYFWFTICDRTQKEKERNLKDIIEKKLTAQPKVMAGKSPVKNARGKKSVEIEVGEELDGEETGEEDIEDEEAEMNVNDTKPKRKPHGSVNINPKEIREKHDPPSTALKRKRATTTKSRKKLRY